MSGALRGTMISNEECKRLIDGAGIRGLCLAKLAWARRSLAVSAPDYGDKVKTRQQNQGVDWKTMGFTHRNIGQALMWGVGSGILLMVVIWFTTEHKLAPFFALQLIVGIPIWLLIMSPFQEFFFRGWLQPRFEKSLGL